MITYINEKNARDYEVLFSKATDILSKEQILGPDKDNLYVPYEGNGFVLREDFRKNPTDFYVKDGEQYIQCTEESVYDIYTTYYVENYPDITTLEKYFSVLGDLLKIEGGDKDDDSYEVTRSQGRRFTMLPLDGDVFEVNANTREISVPESFRKNGIAVQGDDLAEVVYFKIDRFFDATDLDTCNIYIQWEAPTGEIGVSLPWVVDIESNPNKMVIGWALSKRITPLSGNLKFSLRFFKTIKNEKNEEELIFSFGTLTAIAQVKSTLNVDMNKVGIDKEIFKEVATDRNIVNRIANSHTKVTNVTPVNDPAWDAPTVTKETYFDLDPEMVWSEEDLGAAELFAEAHSTDGGIVTYHWRKIAEDGSITYPDCEDVYVPIGTDRVAYAREKGVALYEKQDTQPISWKVVSITESTTDEDIARYFEKRTKCKVGAVGTYVAAATNRKGFATKTAVSEKYIVPKPEPFVINSQYGRANELPVDGTITLELEVTQQDAKYSTEEGTHAAVLSYKWFRNGEEIADSNVQDLAVTQPGWYQAVITNTRNEAIVTTDNVAEENRRSIDQYMDPLYRTFVAHPATPAQLAYPVDADLTVSGDLKYVLVKYEDLDQAAELDKFKVVVDHETWGTDEFVCGHCGEVNEDEVKGGLTYQWFQVKGDPDTPTDNAANPQQDELIEGATAPEFNPKEFEKTHGNFYCKITNKLIHGGSADAYSPLFFLMANN